MATAPLHLCLVMTAFARLSAEAQTPIDLPAAAKAGTIEVHGRELTVLNEPGHAGIRLSTDYGEGLAWLKGIDLADGTIELDVRGAAIEQHSFVGIAFHGANDSTFDAIYLRPFQFKKTDAEPRSHSIQYISLPRFTWRWLRATSPGTYERAIDPAPDPNDWVHLRVVVQGDTVSTFVNGAKEPSLVVKKATERRSGRVGFYVADTSGGDFANIRITPAK